MGAKFILIGSSGMIGQGALHEAISDPEVESVLLVNRKPSALKHPKIKEIIHQNFYDVHSIASQFAEYDACVFSLGQSAVGMKEEDYRRITYDPTVHFAKELIAVNPNIRFIYISGSGTDSTEKGGQMWARVKGKTENALLKMPFRSVHMFRPGLIQPRKGIRSRTSWYNAIYALFFPLYLFLYPFKGIITDTTRLGRALVRVGRNGSELKIIAQRDINRIAET